MIVGVGIKAVLLLVAVTLRVCPVLPGPTPIPDKFTVCSAVVFSRTVGLTVIGLSVGAWLTGVTVTVKVRENVTMPPLAVLPLSVTVTVIVDVPEAKGSRE